MPKINIVKSVAINAPADKIYTTLSNFNLWQAWSPWLIMEPDAKVRVAGDGRSYQWEGDRVGTGNMAILSEQKDKLITYSLNFLKPWKSKADVSFRLETKGETTQVYWTMDSSLPFFLFWMKKMMVIFVGMDYDRGLKMLKEVVEDGAVRSKLEFKGVSDFPEMQYVGLKTLCTPDEIGEVMAADFCKLGEATNTFDDSVIGKTFSIYHKFDPVKQKVEYTAGIEVKKPIEDLPNGLIQGEIPATRIYTLRHIGSYQHLGNAWTTLYNMQRSKEIKCKKGIHPFELYINNPNEASDVDLITDINFAVK